jgi:hypothetical protein
MRNIYIYIYIYYKHSYLFRYINIILKEFQSTHHPITQATSTQGKIIILYNSTSMFIIYQPINFYFILNFILFIEEYRDVYTAM